MCSLVAERWLLEKSSKCNEEYQLKKLLDKINSKYIQQLKRNYLLCTGDNKVDKKNRAQVLGLLVGSGDFTLPVLNTHLFADSKVL